MACRRLSFLGSVRKAFEVTENGVPPSPNERGQCGACISTADGTDWRLPDDATRPEGVVESLDVSILQDRLLDPILGIKDVRTDKRIDFVGGIRGTEELEKLVDEGKAAVAFSLYPRRSMICCGSRTPARSCRRNQPGSSRSYGTDC